MAEKQAERVRRLFDQIALPVPEYPFSAKERMLEMSDGTHLRTRFWMPEGPEQVSVIVTRTCYPQQEAEFTVYGEEYARRGFGFVVQWCRGINGSEGDWEPNTWERQDGLDTMNYLARLPEVKNIGYWGNSYLASTGWCMADAVPDKVKSMYLGVYGTDRYTSVYQDGLFRQDIFTAWAMDNAGVPITADYEMSCRYRPQMQADEKLWGVRLPWYRDWIGNADRESDYWSREGFWKMMSEIPGKMKIPVFIREGWYDHHLGSAVVSWNRLSGRSRANSTLQIGPWRHNYDYVLEGQSTERLTDDSVASPYEWFTETLKEEKLPPARCRLYMIGADRWIETSGLGEEAHSKRFYLDAGRKEGRAFGLGGKVPQSSQVSYCYDPEDPVMSHGTESCFKTVSEIGSILQPEAGYREDVVSFVTEPLPEALEILGSIKVKLYVSSDAEDTAFTAKIMEIFEDGRCVNIRSMITTLAYRNKAVKRGTYEPGTIEPITIEMWPVAWKLREGSRLRIDLSSSDFPQYAVHSNYPGNWSLQERTKKALQTIYTGEAYPSGVELPLYGDE